MFYKWRCYFAGSGYTRRVKSKKSYILREEGKALDYMPIGRTIPSPAQKRERYIIRLERRVMQLGFLSMGLAITVIALAAMG